MIRSGEIKTLLSKDDAYKTFWRKSTTTKRVHQDSWIQKKSAY